MKKNIIILGPGLSGSSMLTSLFKSQGYWHGHETKKKDYDTFENSELVDLNNQIMEQVGFRENWIMKFSPEYIDRVVVPAKALDPQPFRDFIAACENHEPWIWKDPRLWLTLQHWLPFLPLDRIFFIVLKREIMQSWISTTLRRQIQTVEYLRHYNDGVCEKTIECLSNHGLPYLSIVYEDLIMRPESVLAQINQGAGTELTLADFQRAFRGKPYRRQYGLWNLAKALLIFLKNYPERYRLDPLQQ